ncbi:DUF5953 family protein [Melittangium boletus]|uniref:DUF5953 family protein n=1 Tax=Melittangium boletus TaxID=83453 RepID=UPI003CCBA0FD
MGAPAGALEPPLDRWRCLPLARPRAGKLLRLPRREAWLTQARPTGRGFRLICNGDESYRVTVSGWESPAGLSPEGQAQFEFHA